VTVADTIPLEGPDCVLASTRDGVMTLTLNRPQRHNGWTMELEKRYFELLDEAKRAPDVRAIVLTGAGDSFCPGLDLNVLKAMSEVGGPLSASPRTPQSYPHTILKPYIAAINGACAGIGFIQAMMCDVRFMADDAKISTSYARRGLVAEHGLAWLLPRLIGVPQALDLLLTGKTITAAEALELGIVKAVVPRKDVLATAWDYAKDLADNSSPMSMAAIKWAVYRQLQEPSFDVARLESIALMEATSTHPDFAEGVSSFKERRRPVFAGSDGSFDPAALAGLEETDGKP
jgi:enoyl-CoA hydratase/carnithine racemase